MTLEEFIKDVLGDDAKNLSQQEIEAFYNACVGFFGVFFNKWKKEKIKS
jgi:hypothetical protein